MSLISNKEIKRLRDYFDLNQVEYEVMAKERIEKHKVVE